MLTVYQFMEQDQDKWDELFEEDDYQADMQLQQEYYSYCNEPRLNLEFVCDCVSPLSKSFLDEILDNLDEIEDDSLVAGLKECGWSELDVTGYGSSTYKSSANNQDYFVLIHSAIEHIYKAV